MVYSHLCWQCSNKNRKCREHINTLGKKDKLIFLKPIFEIKTKNLLSTWKGTRVLVPRHQNSGAPTIFLVFSWLCILNFCWQYSDITKKCQEHINTLRKKEKLIFLKPILDIKTKTCWSSWKGTKVLVPPAFLAGLSWKNMPTNAGNVSIKPGNIRNTIVCLAKKWI